MATKEKHKGSFANFFDRVLPRADIKGVDRFLEIISAALMALATICSAWSAYQAATWGGVQIFRLNEANASRAQELRYLSDDAQFMTFDAIMLMQYLQALTNDNTRLADIILSRFRPDVKPSVDAWLAAKPFENPDAPRSPFIMKEYRSSFKENAQRFQQLTTQRINEASAANRNGDNYVLLTVLFASVLFFAGISTKFQSRRVKAGLLLFGIIAFLSTATVLITYPVTWSGVVPRAIE